MPEPDQTKRLETDETKRLEADIEALKNWTRDDETIKTKLKFKNFRDAFAFMTDVAKLAEQHNHHPDWFNSYNRIEIALTSHDVKKLTSRDIRLARAINDLLKGYECEVVEELKTKNNLGKD